MFAHFVVAHFVIMELLYNIWLHKKVKAVNPAASSKPSGTHSFHYTTSVALAQRKGTFFFKRTYAASTLKCILGKKIAKQDFPIHPHPAWGTQVKLINQLPWAFLNSLLKLQGNCHFPHSFCWIIVAARKPVARKDQRQNGYRQCPWQGMFLSRQVASSQTDLLDP